MTYSSLAMPAFTVRQPRRAIAPASSTLTLPAISRIVIYVTLACLLGLVYLVQVTTIDAKGYKVYKYQDQQQALLKAHDDLVLAAAQAQNLDRVQNSAVAQAMVPITPQ